MGYLGSLSQLSCLIMGNSRWKIWISRQFIQHFKYKVTFLKEAFLNAVFNAFYYMIMLMLM